MQSNEPSAVEKKVVDDEIIATAAESVASESSVHSSVKELERKDSRDEMFGDQRMRKESQVNFFPTQFANRSYEPPPIPTINLKVAGQSVSKISHVTS